MLNADSGLMGKVASSDGDFKAARCPLPPFLLLPDLG
jgi:hypothetical protein